MRLHQLALCLAIFCLAYSHCDAKTVFRRTDKISENFKQLNLPAEEIDPNVAPPEPQKIETIDPADVVNSSNGETTATGDESVAEDSAAATNEVLDESVNEIEGAGDAVPAVAAAAEEAAVEVAEEVAEAATPAAVTTSTTIAPAVNTTESPLSRYCKCSADHCDCCRNFNLPLIPVRGPGCAKITYLGNEKMSVSLKYGDITLATRTISSKNSRPLCVGLPGGYSKFCGRVYGLSRAKDNFKACLGFELRADDEVEAALRVSCFKFGPGGLKVAEAEPFPVNKDEEDEDDDIFGFAAGGDDEDEDEDDYDESDDADDADDADDSVEDDEPEAPEDADYGGFSLGDFFDDDEDDEPAKPSTVAAAAITPPPAVDLTRTATDGAGDAQSKVDKDAGTLPAEGSGDAATTVVAEAAAADASSPAAPTSETTPSKSKKSKKSKKKKAVADVETDFAYELLNGILDFFN